MQHSHRTPHAPDYTMSVREILEDEGRFSEETLDRMEHLDTMDTFRDWGMVDLIAHANRMDIDYRQQAREERRQKAAHRLCRIIAMQYTRAVLEGDIDECDRLADELVLATRTWCNG